MPDAAASLAPLFRAVGAALRASREAFNAADEYNHNHGDHMVETFELAAGAAERLRDAPPAQVMQAAAAALRRQADNGSAQVYAGGLEQLAQQFARYNLTLDDFLAYVRKMLAAEGEPGAPADPRSGEVLKALVNGLVGWKAAEQQRAAEQQPAEGQPPAEIDDAPAENRWAASLRPAAAGGSQSDLGALFDLGMAYLQARARGGERSQVLADAAAAASPLSQVPYRYESGKLAIRALLEAMHSGQAGG